MAFVPPSNLAFSMGSTEDKMNMSLDDIIKANKKKKVSASPLDRPLGFHGNGKSPGNGRSTQKARLQKAAANRASASRQERLAVARQGPASRGAALGKAAARKALVARLPRNQPARNNRKPQGAKRPRKLQKPVRQERPQQPRQPIALKVTIRNERAVAATPNTGLQGGSGQKKNSKQSRRNQRPGGQGQRRRQSVSAFAGQVGKPSFIRGRPQASAAGFNNFRRRGRNNRGRGAMDWE